MDKTIDSHTVPELIAQIEAYAEEVQHSMNSIMERLDALSNQISDEDSSVPSNDPVLHDDHIEEAAVNMSENLELDPIGMAPNGDTAVTENPVEVPNQVTPSVNTVEQNVVSNEGKSPDLSSANVPVQQFDPVGISQESEVQVPPPVAPGTPVFEPPQEVVPQAQTPMVSPEPVSSPVPTVPPVVQTQTPQAVPVQQTPVVSDPQGAVGGGGSPVFQV